MCPAGSVRKLVFIPAPGHAYNRLFSRAVSAYGILEEPVPEFTNAWLRREARNLDGLHFHWVHQLWAAGRLPARARKLAAVIGYCLLAKRLELPIIWTVHDLPAAPHTLQRSEVGASRWYGASDERTEGMITHLGTLFFARYSDLIIVHSDSARRQLERFRPRPEVIRMPHGNFSTVLSAKRDRAATLAAYKMNPARPVLGMIGRVRPERGHVLAIESMALLSGEAQLLMAGRVHNQEYARKLEVMARGIPDALFVPGSMSDQDYADAVAACDVILLPYSNITTSGALLSAWSLGRPVVTSDLPLFREFAPADPAAGLIVTEPTAEALAEGVRRILSFSAARRQQAVAAERDKYDWERLVFPVAEAMHELFARRSRAAGPTCPSLVP
jgi:glycosyltransferase involved in cell wall biosynthesis